MRSSKAMYLIAVVVLLLHLFSTYTLVLIIAVISDLPLIASEGELQNNFSLLLLHLLYILASIDLAFVVFVSHLPIYTCGRTQQQR